MFSTSLLLPGTVLSSKLDLHPDPTVWMLLRTRGGYFYITLKPIFFLSIDKEWTKFFLPRNLIKVLCQPCSRATLPLARVV